MEIVYRAVNKYTDFSTGEDHYEYGEPSEKQGTAKLRGTLLRHPNGKSRPTKKIGNRYNSNFEKGWGGRTYESKSYYSWFEFVETWIEKAVEWERV